MVAHLAIRRLSARTPAQAQPVAARLALQALGADLEDALPRGMPPQALLWLRRLRLEVPAAALQRPAPPAWRQDWIATGRERLDAALAAAVRPALHPVPGDAPAVLFADVAEMLACLALAAQRGQLDCWWWRGLLGRAWPQWQSAWAARPEAQVAARRLLHRVGRDTALPFEAVASEGRVPAPLQRGLRVEVEAEPVSVARAVDAAQPVPPAERVGRHGAVPRSPSPLCPASPAGAEAVALVEALMARPTAPDFIAADGSVPMERACHEPASRSMLADQRPPGQLPASRAAAPGAADAPAPRAPPRVPLNPTQREVGDKTLPSNELPAAVAAQRPGPASFLTSGPESEHVTPCAEPATSRLLPRPSTADLPASHAAPAIDIPPPALPASDRDPQVPRPVFTPPEAPIANPEAAWPWPQAVSTRQAPLLFLVNALLDDGLYPDFTRPRDPGLPAPLWALLGALARAWRLPPDPLHAALAERTPDWPRSALMPKAPGVSAAPWPAWLPAYARSLRRRLSRRLGIRPAQWPQALTLAQPARLWLSEAEWVAEFDLAVHDVAWRLAGLDRDPGWLPSTGISLRFRFS